MASPAAAGDDDDHAVFGDDSDEELAGVDDDSEDEEDEDEKPVAHTVPLHDLNFSSPSSSSSSEHAPNPKNLTNPNTNKHPTTTTATNPYGTTTAAVRIQIAPIAASKPAAAGEDDEANPSPKRQKTEEAISEDRKPAAVMEDSRRLFQRLWTDEDEIAILQGFLDFTSQRSAATAHHSHHHDTGPFYDQIKTRLQLEFNKNQLVEKLRRLKKKYRNIMNRMGSGKDYAFKSPHDQATFEISRKIWSNSNKYSRAVDVDEDDQINNNSNHTEQRMRRRRSRKRSVAAAAAETMAGMMTTPEAPVEVKVAESHVPVAMASSVPSVMEETVRTCLSPLFKELIYCAVGPGTGLGGGSALGLSPPPLTFVGNPVNFHTSGVAGEKWKKQQILELEVYSKRLELVQEQIKVMLEELRSKGR